MYVCMCELLILAAFLCILDILHNLIIPVAKIYYPFRNTKLQSKCIYFQEQLINIYQHTAWQILNIPVPHFLCLKEL